MDMPAIPVDGTPEALRPRAEELLAWVARIRDERGWLRGESGGDADNGIARADVRNAELCALAVCEWEMFFRLYFGEDTILARAIDPGAGWDSSWETPPYTGQVC